MTTDSSLGIITRDHEIADLLGLSLSEYRQLSHSGLRVVRGFEGKPIYYYMMISPLNPDNILEKLRHKMDKKRTVCFPAEAIGHKHFPAEVFI